jgi:hypothetical protein
MAIIPQKLRDLLFGNPFGEVYPPKPNPEPLAVDGRTVALRLLREYIAAQNFWRSMGPNVPPKRFNIPVEHIHIEWPDNEEDMVTPSIAFVQKTEGVYAPIGLTCYVEERTQDMFGPGTVVQWQSEYTEPFQIEVHASKKPERRGILAALETCLTPTEQMYGLRFRMPDYFDQLVCFSLQSKRINDDQNSAKDQRVAVLNVEMRHHVVALVNYRPLGATVTVNTDVDQTTGLPVDVEIEGSA